MGYGYGYGPPPSYSTGTEPVFMNDGTTYVSRSRCMLSGATFPVNTISSVRLARIPKGSAMLIWGIVLTLSVVLSPIGVILCILYFVADDKYAVVIGSGGFERSVLVSSNPAYPTQIVAAINEALATRA